MKWAKTPIFKVGKIRFFFGFSTAVSPNQGLQLKKRPHHFKKNLFFDQFSHFL